MEDGQEKLQYVIVSNFKSFADTTEVSCCYNIVSWERVVKSKIDYRLYQCLFPGPCLAFVYIFTVYR